MSDPLKGDGATCSVAQVVERVLKDMRESRTFTEQSERRLAQVFRSFAFELEKVHGVMRLADMTPDSALEFVWSSRSGDEASVSTMHFRRSSIRILFATARRLGLADPDRDSTLDLVLPPRSAMRQRPLTDDEVVACRSCSADTLAQTRQPAAMALAEATARTSELHHIVASDLDLSSGRVWIHGGSKTDPRWGALSPWGVDQLRQRVARINGGSDSQPLIYEGKGSAESRQASSCAAISEVLGRAGLASELDVGPGSVAAWAGARALADGMPIDKVAHALGVRSLDQAARLVGWRWDREN